MVSITLPVRTLGLCPTIRTRAFAPPQYGGSFPYVRFPENGVAASSHFPTRFDVGRVVVSQH